MTDEEKLKYRGPAGWEQAKTDLQVFREKAEEYLLKKKGRTPRQRNNIFNEPTPELGLLLGVSYDLIRGANSKDDLIVIENLANLSRAVLFADNAMNFSNLKEHGMIAEIERETRAFVTGYNLAERLATERFINKMGR